jgi:hypothetical protein
MACVTTAQPPFIYVERFPLIIIPVLITALAQWPKPAPMVLFAGVRESVVGWYRFPGRNHPKNRGRGRLVATKAIIEVVVNV